MNPNNSLGGMAERTRDQFIYSENSWANPTTKIDIERVNIRPRKFLLDYSIFFYITQSCSIQYDNMIDQRQNKIKIRYKKTTLSINKNNYLEKKYIFKYISKQDIEISNRLDEISKNPWFSILS